MKSEYIHPNFSPTNKDAYLNLVNRLREECWNTDLKKIEISQEDYDKLQEMIENPPPPSLALIELLNRKAPWEQ